MERHLDEMQRGNPELASKLTEALRMTSEARGEAEVYESRARAAERRLDERETALEQARSNIEDVQMQMKGLQRQISVLNKDKSERSVLILSICMYACVRMHKCMCVHMRFCMFLCMHACVCVSFCIYVLAHVFDKGRLTKVFPSSEQEVKCCACLYICWVWCCVVWVLACSLATRSCVFSDSMYAQVSLRRAWRACAES